MRRRAILPMGSCVPPQRGKSRHHRCPGSRHTANEREDHVSRKLNANTVQTKHFVIKRDLHMRLPMLNPMWGMTAKEWGVARAPRHTRKLYAATKLDLVGWLRRASVQRLLGRSGGRSDATRWY